MLPSAGAFLLALGVCIIFSCAETTTARDREHSEDCKMRELRERLDRERCLSLSY